MLCVWLHGVHFSLRLSCLSEDPTLPQAGGSLRAGLELTAERMEQTLLLSGRYRPITLEGRNYFANKDFYAFFKHLEEKGIESTDRGVMVIAMNKLRQIMLETPEVLDNARLSADGKTLYLIKNKRTNILG